MNPIRGFIFLAAMFLAIPSSSQAFQDDPEDKGETVEPYAVLTQGIKLKFAQVDKQYLGRRCSVYYKKGHDGMVNLGTEGKNQFAFQDGRMIENGEITGLKQNAVDVGWFFSSGGAHGGPISAEAIEYIIVERKWLSWLSATEPSAPPTGMGEFGDTLAPYRVVTGRSVKFPDLAKKDLGLRCTVFIKKSSLPVSAYQIPILNVPAKNGTWTVINGEFNELGKHFLVIAWFTSPHAGSFLPVAEGDIDHIDFAGK